MPVDLLVPLRPAIDAVWYEKLKSIIDSVPELYLHLGPDAHSLQTLRAEFINSNYSKNIALRPSVNNIDVYIQANKLLRRLAEQIDIDEANAIIRALYVRKIRELMHQHNILISTYRQDRAAFAAANQAAYGLPDTDIFMATNTWLRDYDTEQLSHPNAHVRESAQAVIRQTSGQTYAVTNILPNETAFSTVRQQHDVYFEALFRGVKLGDTINQEFGDQAARQTLQNIGSSYTLMDAKDIFWGVMHSMRSVVRPRSYELRRAEFLGILAHEVGSHLLEQMNGSRQSLRLLSLGLDHYEAGNEGRAFLREQIQYDTPRAACEQPSWEHIVTMHYVISLACGLHGRCYGFAECYRALLPVSRLFSHSRLPDSELAETAAHATTWNTVTRVLKGTDGSGGAYLKDIVYLEGNVRCWQVACQRPERILLGDIGKFDITRDDQLNALYDLGIVNTGV